MSKLSALTTDEIMDLYKNNKEFGAWLYEQAYEYYTWITDTDADELNVHAVFNVDYHYDRMVLTPKGNGEVDIYKELGTGYLTVDELKVYEKIKKLSIVWDEMSNTKWDFNTDNDVSEDTYNKLESTLDNLYDDICLLWQQLARMLSDRLNWVSDGINEDSIRDFINTTENLFDNFEVKADGTVIKTTTTTMK